MKLKLLFFMGVLSVLCNTVYGQQNTPPTFQSRPGNRVECPTYTAANIQFEVTDANTPAPQLVVTGSPSGAQTVDLVFRQDPTGILRAVDVIPTAPFVGGVVTITLTLTDVPPPAGTLSATTTFTVEFVDSDAPTITPVSDFDENLDSACSFSIPDYTGLATATDNCSTPTITQSPAIGTSISGHNTTQLITLTATDGSGKTATSTFTITLKDVTNPVVVTKNITVQLDASGNVSIVPADVNNSPADVCGTVTYSLDKSTFSCTDAGLNTVTLTGTDEAGNLASATATVTVEDKIAPTIICNANIQVNADPLLQCGAVVTYALPTVTDNCDSPNPTRTAKSKAIDSLVQTAGLPSGALFPVGKTTNTFVATDKAGNSSSCSFDVTVTDTTPPTVIVQNITVQLDASGNVTITPTQVDNGSTDNCGTTASLILALDKTSFSCSDAGNNTVVLTVTDEAGNSASATATVTVEDKIFPTISTSGSIAIGTDDGVCVGTTTITPATASDNCSVGSPTWVRSDGGLLLNTAFPKGITTITWSVTDIGGNTATATQTVTVTDDENPVISSPMEGGFNSLITVDNDPGQCYYTTANLLSNLGILPTATDNCPSSSLVITVSPETIPVSQGPDHLSAPITWTVTDSNGNTASATQQILVRDLELPVMRTKDITRYFDANGQVVITADDIDDGSIDNSGTACFSKYVVDNIIDCNEAGVHDVALFGKDQWGNQHYSIAKVTVSDNINPTITVTPITVDTNAGCIWTGTLGLPTTADNCSVVSVTSDKAADYAYPIGDTNVVWTVTDAAGNSATATQKVTVKDAENPNAKASDITIRLNASGTATIVEADVNNGSSDNCGIKSLAISKSTFDCTNVGPNRVTLTVTDNSDNVSTVDAIVTIEDKIAPTAIAQPITVQLNSIGGVSITAAQVNNGSTDNCGIKSYAVSPSTFTCANVGPNTVTLTVTDNHNNVSTVNTVVTVEDKVGPVVNTKPFTAYLDASGSVSIVASDVHLSSTDACGIKSMSVSPSTFSCGDIGNKTVVLSVTDINNNVTTANATVTVKDIIAPILVTKPVVVSLDASGNGTITSSQAILTSTDNCAGTITYAFSKSTFNCSNIGTTTVTLVATDAHGNSSLPSNVEVTVQDVTGPTVITRNIPVQLNVGGFVTIVPAQVNNGSTDACGIASYSLDKVSFNCSNVGDNTVTLTVIDIHGNVNSATATVTISEPIIPIARTRNITVQLNAAGTVSILPSDINNGSTDNCSIASYTLSKSTFDCTNVGVNTITLTAIDASGNSSIPTNATVIVEDKLAPVVKTKNITVQLNALGTVSIVPADVNNGSTDNCSITSLTLSKDTFTCANVGSNVISLIAKDPSGNISTAFATVIVEDKIAPLVVAKDISLVLDHGSVTILPEDVLVSATDACGVDVHSYTLSRDTFTIADVLASPVTITVYATDINGNIGSTTVKVIFPINPTTAAQVITPNGDGINDTWVVENITNHQNSVVRVFNRWGSLVYSAKNYQNDWDGKLNGSDATVPDAGSYYYQIDLDGTGKVDSEGWLFISRQ